MSPPLTAAEMDGTFTYQGELQFQGQPATGTFDFYFLLFNVAEGGTEVAGPVELDNVSVDNGSFNVDLNFGLEPFTGEMLWLEIAVREGASVAAHTILTPRQELTSAPFAIQALSVPALEAALQQQVAINLRQRTQIQSLVSFIRTSNRRQNFERVQGGLRERLKSIRNTIYLINQEALPPMTPAKLLQNEINMYRDAAEKIRCTVVGVQQLESDDCITTEEEVIEEDVYEVSSEAQVVYEDFSDAIILATDESQDDIDQAISVSTTPECIFFAENPDNQVAEQLCLASLGLETSEVFADVLAFATETESTSVEIGAYIAPEDVCVSIISDGVDPCEDQSDLADSVGAWESITVEGESHDFEEPNCTATTGYVSILTGFSASCF